VQDEMEVIEKKKIYLSTEYVSTAWHNSVLEMTAF